MQGSPDQFIAIARDVTARRRAEGRSAALPRMRSDRLRLPVARLGDSPGSSPVSAQPSTWTTRPSGTSSPDPTGSAPKSRWTAAAGLEPTDQAGILADAKLPGERTTRRADLARSPPDRGGRPGTRRRPARAAFRGQIGWPVIQQARWSGSSRCRAANRWRTPRRSPRPRPASSGSSPCSSSGSRLRTNATAWSRSSRHPDDFVGIADPNGLVIWRNAAYRESDRSADRLTPERRPLRLGLPRLGRPAPARRGPPRGEPDRLVARRDRDPDGRRPPGPDVAAGHGAPGARRRRDALRHDPPRHLLGQGRRDRAPPPETVRPERRRRRPRVCSTSSRCPTGGSSGRTARHSRLRLLVR